MVDQAGKAIAKADGDCFESNAPRYRKLALGALKPLARPPDRGDGRCRPCGSMVDAFWTINSRAAFKKPVRAIIRAAMKR